mmetsp:Transcript_1847/g.4036  ORF Transcript_1847/g.4036 Transcript_1847/m.4036 type:complete len:239 (-) Transcript_1847:7710-8426(-)
MSLDSTAVLLKLICWVSSSVLSSTCTTCRVWRTVWSRNFPAADSRRNSVSIVSASFLNACDPRRTILIAGSSSEITVMIWPTTSLHDRSDCSKCSALALRSSIRLPACSSLKTRLCEKSTFPASIVALNLPSESRLRTVSFTAVMHPITSLRSCSTCSEAAEIMLTWFGINLPHLPLTHTSALLSSLLLKISCTVGIRSAFCSASTSLLCTSCISITWGLSFLSPNAASSMAIATFWL